MNETLNYVYSKSFATLNTIWGGENRDITNTVLTGDKTSGWIISDKTSDVYIELPPTPRSDSSASGGNNYRYYPSAFFYPIQSSRNEYREGYIWFNTNSFIYFHNLYGKLVKARAKYWGDYGIGYHIARTLIISNDKKSVSSIRGSNYEYNFEPLEVDGFLSVQFSNVTSGDGNGAVLYNLELHFE